MRNPRPALTLRDNEIPGDWNRWLQEQSGDNADRLERLRRNLRRAREAELTDRQREVLDLYYGQGLSMPQIAQALSLNKSTVSRTIARAKRRLYHYLQYSM